MEERVELGFDDTLHDAIRRNVLLRFEELKREFAPLEGRNGTHKRLLKALARSDGKTVNVLKKASLNRGAGHHAYRALKQAGVLHQERSREAPPKPNTHGRKKREERGYTVQHKIKFTLPFHRFWYTFVEPHATSIEQGDFKPFFKDLQKRLDSFVSATFEELANALIKKRFAAQDPVCEEGTYWDRHNEFDLLAKTANRRTIVGECKWKGHRVCKSLVSKLRSKCERSGLRPDYYALFSRSGFSNELIRESDPTVLCFQLKDFEELLK